MHKEGEIMDPMMVKKQASKGNRIGEDVGLDICPRSSAEKRKDRVKSDQKEIQKRKKKKRKKEEEHGSHNIDQVLTQCLDSAEHPF